VNKKDRSNRTKTALLLLLAVLNISTSGRPEEETAQIVSVARNKPPSSDTPLFLLFFRRQTQKDHPFSTFQTAFCQVLQSLTIVLKPYEAHRMQTICLMNDN
jgi:hypothetical protein